METRAEDAAEAEVQNTEVPITKERNLSAEPPPVIYVEDDDEQPELKLHVSPMQIQVGPSSSRGDPIELLNNGFRDILSTLRSLGQAGTETSVELG